jgi:hypothetical protein
MDFKEKGGEVLNLTTLSTAKITQHQRQINQISIAMILDLFLMVPSKT